MSVARTVAWACAVVTAAGLFWMGLILILIGVVPSGDIDGNYTMFSRAAVGGFSIGLWLAAAFIARWLIRARLGAQQPHAIRGAIGRRGR